MLAACRRAAAPLASAASHGVRARLLAAAGVGASQSAGYLAHVRDECGARGLALERPFLGLPELELDIVRRAALPSGAAGLPAAAAAAAAAAPQPRAVASPKLPRTRAVVVPAAADTVFVSAVTAADHTDGGRLPTLDHGEQSMRLETARALSNLKDILAESGCSMGGVVKTTVYTLDLNDWEAEGLQEYRRAFSESSSESGSGLPPCRDTVQVTRLPGGAAVAVSATAVPDGKHEAAFLRAPWVENLGSSM